MRIGRRVPELHRRPESARDEDDRMSMSYDQPQSTVAAGWYADPQGAGHRWWDGVRWTEHTKPEAAQVPQQSVGAGFAPASSAPSYPSVGGFGSSYPGAVTGYPTTGPTDDGFGPLAKPKNGLATWALVAGILVVGVLLFLDYAIVSGIAIVVGVRAVRKARAIKADGCPTAVGMGRAVTGLVLSGIGAVLFLVSRFAG